MSNKYEVELFRYQEDLENISLQLKNLHNGVENFSTAIEQLKVSEEKVVTFVWNSSGMDSFFNVVSESELSELTYEVIISEIWFGDFEHYQAA